MCTVTHLKATRKVQGKQSGDWRADGAHTTAPKPRAKRQPRADDLLTIRPGMREWGGKRTHHSLLRVEVKHDTPGLYADGTCGPNGEKRRSGRHTWRIRLYEYEGFVLFADPVKGYRELTLSLSALPMVLGVIDGTTPPDVFADWLDDHPEAVVDVPHRLYRWDDVPGVAMANGEGIRDRVREQDWEAVAGVLFALRGATGPGRFNSYPKK